MAASDTATIASTYNTFGTQWARGTSPLYENWAVGIARNPEMLALLAELPPPKRQPNLVFAAARWEGCPLAPFDQCREWILAHWAPIVETAFARSTQTNEPNRCATLLPPLSRVDGPIALLEVGTAAGLCLYPDRYSAVYDTPTGQRRLDPVSGASAVTLACRLDDEASVPQRMPEVVWRRGIDLAPIDAGDPAAIDWLANLVWPGPDHDARAARLRAAAQLVAADPPEVLRGDLLETVMNAAATAPSDATLIVFHSAVLLYLDAAGRRRFADTMRTLGDDVGRPVVWLSNETAGTLAEIDAALPPGIATDHRFVQTWDARPIALAGQHGATYETTAFSPAPA